MTSVRSCCWLLAVLILGGSSDAFGQEQAIVGAAPETSARRYSITLVGSRAILLDEESGKTWILTDSPLPGEPPAWLALQQIDDAEQARDFQNIERPEATDQQLKQLLWLKSQLNLAQKRFPKGHPKILELQKQIEAIEQGADSPPPPKTKENSASRSPELLPLILEEQELLLSHGPQHPKVVSLRKKIEFVRNHLEEESESR